MPRITSIVEQLMELLRQAAPGYEFHPGLAEHIAQNDPGYMRMLDRSGYLNQLTPSHIGKLYNYSVPGEFHLTDLRGVPRMPVGAETYRGISLPQDLISPYPSVYPRVPQSFSMEREIAEHHTDPNTPGERSALMTLMPQGNPNRMVPNPISGLSEFILPASARLQLLGSKLAGTEPGELSRYLYTRMPGEARGGRFSRNRAGCGALE